MQLRPEAFHDRIARATPRAAWCHGAEPLLIIEAADAFRAAARAHGHTEREVIHVERGTSAGQLLAAGTSQSLFGDKSLLELRLKTGRLAKDLGEALAAIVSNGDDSVKVLVTSDRLERGVADTAWFKQFDQHAFVVPIYPIERGHLSGWIADRLQRQQQHTDKATLEMMAERVEGNLMAAQQEISKLGLLMPAGLLAQEQVAEHLGSVSRYSPFDLADAALAGDLPRAIRSLDGLRAEAAPLTLIVWALADATRQLYRVAVAIGKGQGVQQAVKAQRAPLGRERLLERAAQRLSAPELQAIVQRLAQGDKMAKGIPVPGHADCWQLLAGVLQSLVATPKNRRPR